MTLQQLTSLENIQVGELFTMITPDFEVSIIQFIGRNPNISNEEYKSKSGYFATFYGPKKFFILSEGDLSSKDTEYYIGYDEEFALERQIEKVNKLLVSMNERLRELKEQKEEY